jgi:hypothetical protein
MPGSEDRVGPAIDVDEAVARNPNVDVDQLREAQELIGELREKGVAPPRYAIGSPYHPGRDRKSAPRARRSYG